MVRGVNRKVMWHQMVSRSMFRVLRHMSVCFVSVLMMGLMD